MNAMAGSEAKQAAERASKPVRLSNARRTAILKALADPRRYELLERIAKSACPLGCAQARAALPISAATLSHHIKELETAGLIDVRREGKFHFLTLRPGVMQGIIAVLGSLDPERCQSRYSGSPVAVEGNQSA
jgi:ArsR family transcriptional regulator, arsenate/arsenite/antimonite-responsive transcriptional repressor